MPPKNKSKEIWPVVDLIEYSLGQYVIREGEMGEHAYFIQYGEVEILKKNGEGREVHIARLGPQEIFGEMCLFEDNPRRSASVRVVSDRAQVMAISKSSFQGQLNAMPDGIRRIIHVMMLRLRKANQQICLLS